MSRLKLIDEPRPPDLYVTLQGTRARGAEQCLCVHRRLTLSGAGEELRTALRRAGVLHLRRCGLWGTPVDKAEPAMSGNRAATGEA